MTHGLEKPKPRKMRRKRNGTQFVFVLFFVFFFGAVDNILRKKSKEAEEALAREKEAEVQREALRKQAEEKEAAKKARDLEKKRAKDARKQLRALAPSVELSDVEKVIEAASTEELVAIVDALKTKGKEAVEV